jgi:anti-sigma regulatory factor (Ser/Thr protein kinase)
MEIANYFLMPICEPSAVGEARRRAARLAEYAGFDETTVGQISIVATELGNNLIKHTPLGGKLIVQVAGGNAFEIVCINQGGGAEDTALWLEDGYSTAGTLGTGLGAVKRLAQEFDIYSDREHGTTVVARFRRDDAHPGFEVGAINLPKDGEPVCGDSWATVEERDSISAVVVDGLGHGIEASEAASAAVRSFKQDPFDDPVSILQRAHTALRGTRGAAISTLQIDRSRGLLQFAGIGNVAALVVSPDKRRHLVPDNGTVGYELRKVRKTDIEWTSADVVIMHTDGLSSSWNLGNYPSITRRSASTLASVLYRDFAKNHDDVTVVVIKPNSRR